LDVTFLFLDDAFHSLLADASHYTLEFMEEE
jgi:hypothetical protein